MDYKGLPGIFTVQNESHGGLIAGTFLLGCKGVSCRSCQIKSTSKSIPSMKVLSIPTLSVVKIFQRSYHLSRQRKSRCYLCSFTGLGGG